MTKAEDAVKIGLIRPPPFQDAHTGPNTVNVQSISSLARFRSDRIGVITNSGSDAFCSLGVTLASPLARNPPGFARTARALPIRDRV